MKHVNQRNTKIVTELMNYCYKNGSDNIHVDVKKDNEKISIFLRAEVINISKENLDLLERLLNAPRCHEMEEYYWNLTGDDDTDSELTLVGMMIDESHIEYINNEYLEILVIRRF